LNRDHGIFTATDSINETDSNKRMIWEKKCNYYTESQQMCNVRLVGKYADSDK